MSDKKVIKYTGPKGGSITFPEGYNETLEQFVKKHEDSHVFRKLEEKARLVEMKKAFNIGSAKPAETTK